MARTHRIHLDKPREITFSANQLRLLDKELGQTYDKGFTVFMQRMDPDSVRDGIVDLRYDILITALKHGLAHTSPGLRDEQVAEWIDESNTPEAELWGTVVEAYTEARGMDLELPEEQQEAGGDDPTRASSPDDAVGAGTWSRSSTG